jgi:UDP-2,3-diacylglucosamine hydrolase
MTKIETAGRNPLGPADKVGIVAGSGLLPLDLAQRLTEAGKRPFIVIMKGEADLSALASYEHEELELENFAALARLLKRHGVTHAVMAGGIGRRPQIGRLRPSLALLALLPKALAALARGDDGVLRSLAGTVEAAGIRIVGAHQLVPDLLAREGPMTRIAPRKTDWRDLDSALAAARAIGALDIGQGAVSIGGRAIALEGIEGTDGMLERVASLRTHGRLAGKTRGVLVKCAKPGQELRLDLPAIGPATIDAAHRAGLAGIGVEAQRSLVLDYAAMVERADALGLFVVGLAGKSPA